LCIIHVSNQNYFVEVQNLL